MLLTIKDNERMSKSREGPVLDSPKKRKSSSNITNQRP